MWGKKGDVNSFGHVKSDAPGVIQVEICCTSLKHEYSSGMERAGETLSSNDFFTKQQCTFTVLDLLFERGLL